MLLNQKVVLHLQPRNRIIANTMTTIKGNKTKSKDFNVLLHIVKSKELQLEDSNEILQEARSNNLTMESLILAQDKR